MPSDRMQRQIDGLLDEAEVAVRALDWGTVRNRVNAVLTLDPENSDARALLGAADRADSGPQSATSSQPAAPAEQSTPPLPVSFAGGRYVVKRFLGEGGRKKVYLAHDTKLDRDVAFAVIKTEGLDADGRSRVQREAQAMGKLGDHPHIVTVFDSGDDNGQPYIVSQYMAGGAVDALEHPIPLERALDIAKGVCDGLAHAHANGIVHRDLKPGNVWLAADGTAKIGDFGLAVALDHSRLTMAGMMVGTVAYMPPEQALGGEVTPRADLYSLGCMLYEMVTGRPPFVSDNPTAVISQHINMPPVAPSWLSDACPQDLEEIVLRLLAKDPGQRPASAGEVLEALERVDPGEKSASHSDSNVLDRLALGVFVGREKELERLRKAFDNCVSGHGGLVMLVGEPGIGKTRTTQELETYARMRGAQVLWGRTHESAGAPPYWPWLQAGGQYSAAHVDDLVTLLGPQMPPGSVSELSRIFPWLKQLPNFVEPEQTTDAEVAQFRLFDAYASYVRAIANQAPLVIALDDLHWADKPTLLMLQHIARELSRMRVLIVANYRDTDITRQSALSETLASLNRESGFDRIVLRGLTRDEVGAYIKARANVEPRREILDRIFEETEGNAFFLSEVVNLMAQEGTLTKDSISDIAIPDGVREALGRRLNRLSEETNELLQIAAIIGRDFTYDTLTLLGERDEDALLKMIDEALEARVLEETEQAGRYRFTHAQMQETLLAELSTTRRVRLHGQVAEALERRYGPRADERATRLALHFVEAATLSPRHAAKAVRYSKLAAQQAEAQSAWDVAARHYEHCLTHASDAGDALGEDEAELLTALGRCARDGGQPRPAWRALMRALTLYRQRGDGIGFARAYLEADLVGAPVERRVPLLMEAIELLGDSDPYLEARLLSVAPFHGRRFGSEEEIEAARRRASELVAAHGFEDVEATLLNADAMRAWRDGEVARAIELWRDTFERRARLGLVRLAASTAWATSLRILSTGSLDEGRVAAEQALAYAQAHHIRFFEENTAGFLLAAMLARCDFAGFDALAAERASDASWVVPALRAARAEMAGDLDAAVALLPDPAAAGGNPDQLALIHGMRARVFANAGQHDRARQELGDLRAAWDADDNTALHEGVALNSFGLGALDDALTHIADNTLLRAVDAYRLGDPVAPQMNYQGFFGRTMQRIYGDVALHLDRLEDAETLYRADLAWCERERCPVEAGRCLQGLADVAERRGDRAEALQLLDRAAALFQQHGAKLYLDRVITKKLELQGVASSSIYTSIDAVARAVAKERPQLSVHPAPDGTVTIMFSDIEDSTLLTERLGDQAWMELLRKHDALIRKQLRAYDGFEVKTIGDAFMVAFQSAKKGLDCAIAIQRAFDEHNAADGERVKVRIGLHAGEAIKDGDDFYGKNVILASRVAGKAVGGEILVSSLLRQLVESSVDAGTFGDSRDVELKGLAGTHAVHAVTWTRG